MNIEMIAFVGVWSVVGLLFIWWRQRKYLTQLEEMNDFVEELVNEGLHADMMSDREMEQLNEYLASEFPLVMKNKMLERL